MTRGRMPVCCVTAWRNSPPFSASRVALVATAMISSTLMRFGQPPEFRQHLERGVHRLGRERAAVQPAGAQPDHFLFAVDDFEGQIGADLHDDHVDRVGADVDGGDAHTLGSLTIMRRPRPAYTCARLDHPRHELLKASVSIAFTRVLTGVEQGDVRALHRARVASRRLRELLPVLQLDHDVGAQARPPAAQGDRAARHGARARCAAAPD